MEKELLDNKKDLLLKDLCARLPYGVKVNNEIQGDFVMYGVCEDYIFVRNTNTHVDFHIEKIKPYLFPMSSMTEEQNLEYLSTCMGGNASFPTLKSFEWCDKHHIDYQGLIPKGLAIDATNSNIY